jgi:hypothetical protein
VSTTVTGPGTVTTDPGGLGASSEVPVQTRLDVPAGVSGEVSVESVPAGPSPSGFVLFGREIELDGPAAPSASAPYVVTFTVDASEVGAVPPDQVVAFRNGVQVAACTGPTDAAPDPCIADRRAGVDGDVEVTLRTTQFSTWTLGRRTFLVTSVAPSSRAQGTTQQTVFVSGDGFQPGATAKVSGSGVTIASTVLASDELMQLTLSVGSGAAVGARDVTVTNPGPSAAVCRGCFTVNAKPTVSSLAPSSRAAGEQHAIIQVSGVGLQAGATAVFGGSGITVHAVSYVDPTRFDVDLSIDPGAATGSRSLTITNPDGGTVTKANAFVVNALPAIAALSPSQLRRGLTTNVAITGSGFPADFVAKGGAVSFGPDLTVLSVVRNSVSKLTASIEVPATAAIGVRTVSVTNPDGGSTECLGCAIVVADPQVSALTPNALARGVTGRTVVVNGGGFQPGAVVKVLGGGVTVASATVEDSATLTLSVSVGGSASLGRRDLLVTNPDTGTTTCVGCLTVNAKPTITSLAPSTVPRGTVEQTVSVSGTGFQPAATVTVGGVGVTAVVVAVTPTALTLEVTVSSGAATGSRAVTVINPDGGTATKATGIKVT